MNLFAGLANGQAAPVVTGLPLGTPVPGFILHQYYVGCRPHVFSRRYDDGAGLPAARELEPLDADVQRDASQTDRSMIGAILKRSGTWLPTVAGAPRGAARGRAARDAEPRAPCGRRSRSGARGADSGTRFSRSAVARSGEPRGASRGPRRRSRKRAPLRRRSTASGRDARRATPRARWASSGTAVSGWWLRARRRAPPSRGARWSRSCPARASGDLVDAGYDFTFAEIDPATAGRGRS